MKLTMVMYGTLALVPIGVCVLTLDTMNGVVMPRDLCDNEIVAALRCEKKTMICNEHDGKRSTMHQMWDLIMMGRF
jgi:hypothetical protein